MDFWLFKDKRGMRRWVETSGHHRQHLGNSETNIGEIDFRPTFRSDHPYFKILAVLHDRPHFKGVDQSHLQQPASNERFKRLILAFVATTDGPTACSHDGLDYPLTAPANMIGYLTGPPITTAGVAT